MSAKSRGGAPASTDTAELAGAVNALRDEVKVLRESIDEFRTDFVHLLRNLPDNLPPPYQHLTTLANVVESCGSGTAQPSESPPTNQMSSPTSSTAASRRRRSLFEEMDT